MTFPCTAEGVFAEAITERAGVTPDTLFVRVRGTSPGVKEFFLMSGSHSENSKAVLPAAARS